MTDTIMPIFIAAPEEAAVIGRLLAGYGEIEFVLAICTGYFTHSPDEAFKAMFKVRSESARLQIADGLIAGPIAELGLASQYADAIGAARHCRNIRNQYAHCHWSNYENGNLFFVSLEKYVEGHSPLGVFAEMSVSLPLLTRQESYFRYAERCLLYLEGEIKRQRGKIKSHAFAMPAKGLPPPLHNP